MLIKFRSILVQEKYEYETKKIKIDLDRFKIDLKMILNPSYKNWSKSILNRFVSIFPVLYYFYL